MGDRTKLLSARAAQQLGSLTVREFLALPSWRSGYLYRLYRHPIVMFGVGPTYLFVLQHRLPVGLMRSSWHFWLSTMATNLAIAVLAATMIWLVGLGPFLLVQLPITLLAGSIGVWLFYASSTNSRTLSGPMTRAGIFTRRRCAAAPIMTCRTSCAGLPPISGCTMSTISAAVRITDCHRVYGITQSLLPSGDLRSLRASVACAWFFGTKRGGGSFPFAKCISSRRS